MKRALAAILATISAPAPATEAERPPPNSYVTPMDKRAIPLEDLAHSFFFHPSNSSKLEMLITEEGWKSLRPQIAALQKEMTDAATIAPKMRRMCSQLKSARNGTEFAAVFIETEREQQLERQEHAKRILSSMDLNDRSALERYLNVEYRQSFNRSTIDHQALYGSETYPSVNSEAITQKTCDSASQMEAMAGN